ncbi:MAG TPA: hypothetical protein VG942_03730 [Hyphomonadaceae bacterium]|nr:hypothetical protein [Hyphomonadaceae bacterium]
MPREARSDIKLIELQLERVEQLFDPFDPFPIPTRDLSHAAEEFIVGWARELPPSASIGIRIHLPPALAASADLVGLKTAIERHFQYRANRMAGDLRELMSVAEISLAIALTVLGLCVGLRQLVRSLMPESPLSGFLSESLLIFGWVANWKPIEILLYEWWPLRRKRRLLLRLAEASIDVVARGEILAIPLQQGLSA